MKRVAQSMRTDDFSHTQVVTCVDCPEYVKLSAQAKQQVLWKQMVSDEYSPSSIKSRECASENKLCHCDGKAQFGNPGKFTSWKKVSGSIKCNADAFGSDPDKWHKKTCICQDNFPMDWVGLFDREILGLRVLAKNGTMPMFFDRFSDENPAQHAKLIHSYGAAATVRFEHVANNLGFTGVFKDGSEYGVIRLSIVADWTKPCKGGTDLNFDGCLKPSMALKILRDGDYSSNTVAQVNLGDGVGWHFNFFNFEHSTWLPMPAGFGATVVKSTFKYASDENEVAGVGLEELASDGSKAEQNSNQIKAPAAIIFVPADGVRNLFRDDEHDPRSDFKTIAHNTHLYDVVAIPNDHRCFVGGDTKPPSSPLLWDDLNGKKTGCPHAIVGRVVTTSRFVSSHYEDTRLFFQHERLKTKGGKWARKACMRNGKGGLPDGSAFRMAGDSTMTCTQECIGDMTLTPALSCPFAKLE